MREACVLVTGSVRGKCHADFTQVSWDMNLVNLLILGLEQEMSTHVSLVAVVTVVRHF